MKRSRVRVDMTLDVPQGWRTRAREKPVTRDELRQAIAGIALDRWKDEGVRVWSFTIQVVNHD